MSAYRQNFNPATNLPAKRKLDDYALLSSPDPNPNPSSSRVRVSSPSCLSASSSSSSIQFFVRTNSKSLVIHASRDSTVTSVISEVRRLIGATAVSSNEFRLIFGGRQLVPESTLAESRVANDSTLHLAARLPSTRLPRSWQIATDIRLSVTCLSEGRPVPPDIKKLEFLLVEFLVSTPTPANGGVANVITNSTAMEHFHVLLLSSVPAALIKLYVSDLPGCRLTADRAIHLFLKYAPDYVPKAIYLNFSSVLLEFCRLTARSAGKDNQLYADCRSALASVLNSIGSNYQNFKGVSLPAELHTFVIEVAAIVIKEIQSETVHVLPSVMGEFSSFVTAMRKAIKQWLGPEGSGSISISLYLDTKDPKHESWIRPLYALFINLVANIDECMKKFKKFPGEKSPDTILDVLSCIRKLSKIYKGAPECFHALLRGQRVTVNALIHRVKMDEKLKWLLKYKDVTNFESKRNLTMMLFPKGKDNFELLHEMLIDRSQLLAESFEYIGQVESQALHGGLFMEFKNEEATGPGVLREWFTLVCRALFNPQNVLFQPCPKDRRRFFPNPASAVDPLHLKYFGFCGRVIALALSHKVQVGIVFDRVFFLQLAGKTITLEDIKDADPCLYMSCKKILEMDAELLDSDILGLTFVRDIEELGIQRAIELCPGGKDILVNSNNRKEYINLLIEHRFVTSTSEQVSHFAQGFSDILSNSKLQKFFFGSLDLEDFDRMLGGSDGINVSDWRSHTEYSGYKVKDSLISWFWKIVEGMSLEQQRVLLFFWTSVKYLPADGFSGLGSKLYIYKSSDSHERLPTSHTCFYRLCLPQYPSISIMRDRLQCITQEHVCCTFGMW